ncbi:hypothetical protein HYH02_006892 [Chlamydomonas schloesseri]|uniref:HIRAN domain-containing protein n=1 Tax=Chlamydomonas schloesseri TaxID=2026947 RepID=A0A835WJ88_9CHLO|nr:hypothetical protein HYH02_006892 [Chlamydomonas schloesseri]|eukprot:KAG2448308.1 hypothetical protein HYH02_006892 [Chlamydomonas schloesseri]
MAPNALHNANYRRRVAAGGRQLAQPGAAGTCSLSRCRRSGPGVACAGGHSAYTETLLEARTAAEQRHAPETFRLAGVTFDGRQDLVRALRPDQVLLLEREPWNPYDPAAVRVTDLRGRTLGYVPRKDGYNSRYSRTEHGFGLVASAGPVAEPGPSNYGAAVFARPNLASLTLEPLLPPAASEAACLSDLPTSLGPRLPALRAASLAAANFRCEVSGASEAQLPLVLTPVWRFNAGARRVQLVRLAVLSQPLAEAKRRLEEGLMAAAAAAVAAGELPGASAAGASGISGSSGSSGAAEEAGAALSEALSGLLGTPEEYLFSEINGLGEEDALPYFRLVCRRAAVVQAEGWQVELLM